jgi:hypothetical protein
MATVTTLAESGVTAFGIVRISLIEPDHEPAYINIHWPGKVSVCGTGRFPDIAGLVVRTFSTAAVSLSAIKADRRL